jgi:ParB-like chromosome segregation protein Spo0J
MKEIPTQMLPIGLIEPNKGQIEGLPKNPRLIRDEHFKKLKKSIEDNPEMLYLREMLVYPHQGKYVVIGGNMRLMAMRDLKYTEAPCKVIPEDTTVEQLKAYTIKDNSSFGEFDWDLLANEWDADLLDDWGVDIPVWDNDGDREDEIPETDMSLKDKKDDMITCPKCNFRWSKK